MASRIRYFTQVPWGGGLNTTVDSYLVPNQQVVTCDNVILGTNGSKIKREGISYWDTKMGIATVSRASSGTTRTLVVNSASYRVGDSVTVAGNASYAGTFPVASVTSTTTKFDTITYTAGSSLAEATTADTSITVLLNDSSASYILLKDFWYVTGGVKTRLMIAVSSDGRIWKYNDSGERSEIAPATASTAITAPLTNASIEVMNDKLVIGMSGTSNTPKIWTGTGAFTDLKNYDSAGNDVSTSNPPPNFEIIREHRGRLWCNDKSRPDRLHYCSPYNPEQWQGEGDSGALDVAVGDGDPVGLAGIAPSFQGQLFVTKQNKVYNIVGDSPETYYPVPLSTGIGSTAHNAFVAVDQDDIYYASGRGWHKMRATASSGDSEAAFVSKDIKDSYNEFAEGRLKYMQGVYLPSLASVIWAVSEGADSANNDLWVLNIDTGQFSRWPDISCQSICTRTEGTTQHLFLGTNTGRILQAQNGFDFDYTNTAITYRVKTGSIYPDGSPKTLKAFKNISLLYRPVGTYSLTVNVQVDNMPVQTFTLSQTGGADELGVNFTLGASTLGTTSVLAPYEHSIDGLGRGVTIEVIQSGVNQSIDLYGFMIGWEPAEAAEEVDAE